MNKTQEWTREPWEAQSEVFKSETSTLLGTCYPQKGVEDSFGRADRNAARIVSCVNGCAGLADPGAIGELIEAVSMVFDHIGGGNSLHPDDSYTDDLRAALRRVKGDPDAP